MKRSRTWKRGLSACVCCLFAAQFAMAQGTADRRMSIDKTNAGLEEILNEVRENTGYKMFYNSRLLRERRATVRMTNATVDEILKKAFAGTGLTYRLENGTIVIRRAEQQSRPGQEERRRVQGTVVDKEGMPLAGATVRVEGQAMGAATDADGHFDLSIPSGTRRLEVSFIGMKTALLELTKRDHYVVTLEENSVMLADVVATGYQTISRERATGSYSILTDEEMERRHATKFSSILDGLVAGAQGTDDGRGGTAYQIRGTGTMMADDMPLVVVDGFPLMDTQSNITGDNPALTALEKINPNDVESVTVLKDAAAASIWGARSANGVIVITTKKGNKQKRWEVNVNTQLSVGHKKDVGQMLNRASSADMIAYQRMLFERQYMDYGEYYGTLSELTNPVTSSELLLYKGIRWGTISEDEMNAGLERLARLDNAKQIKDYFLENPFLFQTNASVSGGTEKYNTYASLLYQHDSGDFIGKQENSFMANWNNNFTFNRYLSLNVGLALQQENAHSSVISENDLRNLSPYEMLLDEDGNYATHVGSYNTDVLSMFDWSRFPYHDMNYNMLQEARTRNSRTVNTMYRAQIGLQVNIIDGLRFNSRFQYEENRYRQRTYSSEESFAARFAVNEFTPGDYDGNPQGDSVLPMGGIRNLDRGSRRGMVFRNDISFDRTFGERHALSVVLGNELSRYRSSTFQLPTLYGCTSPTAGGTMGPSGYFTTLDGYSSTVSGVPLEGKEYLSESYNDNRYVSFYGNASYTYDERYGLSLSARSDASNLITSEPKYRWSPLWSTGLMWHLSNERFLKNVSWLDRLTLRLTYGQNGNACSISSARTTINTNITYPDNYTGLLPGRIADYGNPTLRWEKTSTTNVGLDFALLGNRLFGSIDFYNKKGTDILGTVTMSAVNGTSSATFNNAELLNRGVEVTLGGRFNAGEAILSANVTYAYNKNKILSLYNELTMVNDMIQAEYVEGYPLSSIFAFHYLGTDESGVPQVSDGRGGSYTIDDFNMYLDPDINVLRYMGTRISPHTLGVQLNGEWRGFNLSALFTGRFGGKMQMPTFNYSMAGSYEKMTLNAQLSDVLAGDPNTMPIPDADIPAEVYANWSMAASLLDNRVESASYIYCKEVVMDYTFPQFNRASRIVKGLNLFAKVENLGLIWTANSKHYHPEYLPGQATEPVVTWTLGARVNF